MRIPSDKIAHALAGLLAALAGIVLAALLPLLVGEPIRAITMAVGAVVAATSAGLVKEFADFQDNRVHPGMHGVELLDAVATAAPGWLLGVVLVCACGRWA